MPTLMDVAQVYLVAGEEVNLSSAVRKIMRLSCAARACSEASFHYLFFFELICII